MYPLSQKLISLYSIGKTISPMLSIRPYFILGMCQKSSNEYMQPSSELPMIA